jgi:hypothetical protein
VCSMEIWMETEAGTKVLEGTASVGCGLTDPLDHPSALAARLARERPPGREGLRIMANLEVGQQSDRIPARYNYGAKLEGMGNLEWGPAQALLTTEPLDWYVSDDTSPWGHKVLPPQHMFNIFNARQYPGDHWPTREKIRGGGAAVGLLGGVEVRTCGKGPILCDHDCERSLLCPAPRPPARAPFLVVSCMLRPRGVVTVCSHRRPTHVLLYCEIISAGHT